MLGLKSRRPVVKNCDESMEEESGDGEAALLIGVTGRISRSSVARARPPAVIPAIQACTWRCRTVSTRNPDPAYLTSSSPPRVLVDVTTGRDRARSGVDAVRYRRDDLRPAGMTRSRLQPGPPARSRRPIGAAQPGGRQAVGSWAACRPAVVRPRARWARA